VTSIHKHTLCLAFQKTGVSVEGNSVPSLRTKRCRLLFAEIKGLHGYLSMDMGKYQERKYVPHGPFYLSYSMPCLRCVCHTGSHLMSRGISVVLTAVQWGSCHFLFCRQVPEAPQLLVLPVNRSFPMGQLTSAVTEEMYIIQLVYHFHS
jgi:hypothetical protein